MKAYKLEILVIDHDNIGEDAIISEIENARYSNHCINPDVKRVIEKDIGEWHDDHPFNKRATSQLEYVRLFEDKY